jgi:hypothetical protein
MRTVLASLVAVSCAGPTLAADLQAPILMVHNRERAEVGVPALVWSGALAAHAAVWAEHLAKIGALQHSQNQDRPGEGENLWMGTANRYTPDEMAQGWAGEKKDFRNGVFPDVSRSGNWQAVGHYTQMIWKGTTEIGCAIATGGQYDVLVCRYGPPGNMMGEAPF